MQFMWGKVLTMWLKFWSNQISGQLPCTYLFTYPATIILLCWNPSFIDRNTFSVTGIRTRGGSNENCLHLSRWSVTAFYLAKIMFHDCYFKWATPSFFSNNFTEPKRQWDSNSNHHHGHNYLFGISRPLLYFQDKIGWQESSHNLQWLE